MKIYFDESGQSGCVLQKEDLLNFQTQPTFALSALVLYDEQDEARVIDEYEKFKNRFNFDKDEIKGNELLVKKRNDELNYFLNNILDDKHFFVIIYDKRFYISTLLLTSLFGIEYQSVIPIHYYQQATFLSKQKDDFFIEYLKFIENPTKQSFQEYLNFIIEYEYLNQNSEENAIVTIAKEILGEKMCDKFYGDFMTYGWYSDDKIVNLINLNALSELIFFIKSEIKISNNNIEYYHDNILEFEDTFKDELKNHGINLNFLDSKSTIPLQIVDNIASIFRHAYDKTIMHFKKKEQWEKNSEWDLKLMSKIQRKISISHIKYTVPFCDWSLLLCVEKIFYDKYPQKYRNNIHFNIYYIENMQLIYNSIPSTNNLIHDVMSILEK